MDLPCVFHSCIFFLQQIQSYIYIYKAAQVPKQRYYSALPPSGFAHLVFEAVAKRRCGGGLYLVFEAVTKENVAVNQRGVVVLRQLFDTEYERVCRGGAPGTALD